MRDVVTIEIPESLRVAFDALPDRPNGSPRRAWTTEEDSALLKYWMLKKQDDVARLIGVSVGTARRRYAELTRSE